MSFGLSVSDFITVIGLTNQIRKEFVSAPKQFKSISDEKLLDSSKYQEWLQGESRTLFCQGIPGARETILTSIIIDELTTCFGNDDTIGIAYIYCNFKQQHTQKIEDLLASLLKQLAQNLSSLPVTSLFSRVFIIVDALDECQMRSKLTNTTIFVTSRFIPEIENMFHGSISLEIRASPEDVRRYIDGHISRLVLLAQLHLDSLIGKKSPKAIQVALTKLPTGSEAYDEAYKGGLGRIEGQVTDQKDLAKQVLSWIICAQRPLTMLELQHALAVEPGESKLDEIISRNEETDIIRLVHHTAQEYFERTQTYWFPDSNKQIIGTSITYLSFDVFKNGRCQTDAELTERLQANPFYNYAAQNWGHHARKYSSSCREVLDFLKFQSNVEALIQAQMASKKSWRYSTDCQIQTRGLHLAAYFGLLEKDANIESTAKNYGQTPLSFAAENGHETVVRLLLERGADTESVEAGNRTRLSWAAENGYTAIVRLLLKNGANAKPNDTRDDQMPPSWNSENGDNTVVEAPGILEAQNGDPNLVRVGYTDI
ncbi:hypothetical protein F4810DRAFT_703347 [Camillea tinctor]|nr:hypothetical protein F4810DRAFT_703347 [Camillea tinctor]